MPSSRLPTERPFMWRSMGFYQILVFDPERSLAGAERFVRDCVTELTDLFGVDTKLIMDVQKLSHTDIAFLIPTFAELSHVYENFWICGLPQHLYAEWLKRAAPNTVGLSIDWIMNQYGE